MPRQLYDIFFYIYVPHNSGLRSELGYSFKVVGAAWTREGMLVWIPKR